MSSLTAISDSYKQVMEVTGFYRNGIPTSGVFDTKLVQNELQHLEKYIKYNVAIKELNATAIYELSGSPCIYFTQIEQADPAPETLANLRKIAWNNGLAPLLWIVTPTKVLLYNNYSKPSQQDENDPNRHLIELFKITEEGLKKLNQHASRLQFESGEFWKWEKAKQVDRKQRVDKVLVEDLNKTEKCLVEDQGLKRSVAQSLIIQSIFITYLQDRELLNPGFFKSRFQVGSFIGILDSKSLTNQLFNWIQETFNGDLFPLSDEDKSLILLEHLKTIKNFIGGVQEIDTGQLRLWKAYDFKIIPVELISSIYEKFIYAEDTKTALESSTHYTPINLVDLVLSEVLKPLDGKARILDLSCGSGVFLVESLRRLIVKRCMAGESPSRQLVRETLYNQIYGVDIKEKAIQIAAFSLYLTVLEMDYELAQKPQMSDDLRFESIIGKNLFVNDAFDEEAEFSKREPFLSKQFNAIIGNPPWTKSKLTQSAVNYCKRKKYPTAYGTPPDQAFLWRIGDFVNATTQIGFILHGKPFFSNDSNAINAKKELFTKFKPKIIINLSKLRRDHLFPNSEAPALILIAEGKPPESQDSCYFVCPERSLDYRRHGVIEISPENIKKLSVYSIAFDSDILKIATWGNARDMYLIQQLRESFPTIDKVIGNSPKSGLKVGNQSQPVPQEFFKMKFLSSSQLSRYQVNINNLSYFPYSTVAEPRDINIYKSLLLIIPEKVQSEGIISAFSSKDIIYTNSYSGISFAGKLEDLAYYTNGIINSSLASYFIFMTASVWGIERHKIMTQDITRLPIPQSNDTNYELIRKIIDIEGQLRECTQKSTEKKLKRQLDDTVFDIYGLNETERVLVEDTTQLTIDLYMNREESKAIRRSVFSELENYAKTFISVIQPFLQTLNERKIIAEIINVSQAPLQVIKFSLIPTTTNLPTIREIAGQNLQSILKSIAEQLPQQIADRIYTRRNLRIYLEDELYIFKPAKRIYWSRSAGFNDADLVLAEHLGVNNASFR